MPEKHISQNQSQFYNPQKDGTLEEYFERCSEKIDGALFKGSNQFRMLWGQGYISPETTMIMIKRGNMGRDEHFSVINQSTLRGIFMPGSSGKPGDYDINILDSSLEYQVKNPFTRKIRNELEQSRKIKIPRNNYQDDE